MCVYFDEKRCWISNLFSMPFAIIFFTRDFSTSCFYSFFLAYHSQRFYTGHPLFPHPIHGPHKALQTSFLYTEAFIFILPSVILPPLLFRPFSDFRFLFSAPSNHFIPLSCFICAFKVIPSSVLHSLHLLWPSSTSLSLTLALADLQFDFMLCFLTITWQSVFSPLVLYLNCFSGISFPYFLSSSFCSHHAALVQCILKQLQYSLLEWFRCWPDFLSSLDLLFLVLFPLFSPCSFWFSHLLTYLHITEVLSLLGSQVPTRVSITSLHPALFFLCSLLSLLENNIWFLSGISLGHICKRIMLQTCSSLSPPFVSVFFISRSSSSSYCLRIMIVLPTDCLAFATSIFILFYLF